MPEPKGLLDTALAGVKKGKVYDIELLLHQSASGAGYTWGLLFLVVETAECASPGGFFFSPRRPAATAASAQDARQGPKAARRLGRHGGGFVTFPEAREFFHHAGKDRICMRLGETTGQRNVLRLRSLPFFEGARRDGMKVRSSGRSHCE